MLLVNLRRGFLVTAMFCAGTMFAQGVATAPVPPALGVAKTVFISNAGADSGLFPHPFSGKRGSGLQPVLCDGEELGSV
jgi:hypothetical protein